MEHSWDRRLCWGKERPGYHTHTHTSLESCEPEMGDCLARADRWIQRVPRFPTCRRSQLCSQRCCGSLWHPEDIAHLFHQQNTPVALYECDVYVCACG